MLYIYTKAQVQVHHQNTCARTRTRTPAHTQNISGGQFTVPGEGDESFDATCLPRCMDCYYYEQRGWEECLYNPVRATNFTSDKVKAYDNTGISKFESENVKRYPYEPATCYNTTGTHVHICTRTHAVHTRTHPHALMPMLMRVCVPMHICMLAPVITYLAPTYTHPLHTYVQIKPFPQSNSHPHTHSHSHSHSHAHTHTHTLILTLALDETTA